MGNSIPKKNAIVTIKLNAPPGTSPETLSIGITGHRFLRDGSILRAGLIEAVQRIKGVFPGRLFTVLSPLAEGADRLAAGVLLQQPGARLVVPLPLSRDEYMKDFDTAESRSAFLRMLGLAADVVTLPPATSRNEAYEAAGLYVLEHCDLLVALWDGADSRGRGGTAEIVAAALKSGKPVCHIWAGNNSPVKGKRTDVGEKHGRLRWFNFPAE